MQGPNKKVDTILIWTYDNRSHHAIGNDVHLALTAAQTIKVGNVCLSVSERQKMALSYNRPFDRIVYFDGFKLFAWSIGETMDRQICIEALGGMEVVITNLDQEICTRKQLPEGVINWINDNILIEDNVCKPKHIIPEGELKGTIAEIGVIMKITPEEMTTIVRNIQAENKSTQLTKIEVKCKKMTSEWKINMTELYDNGKKGAICAWGVTRGFVNKNTLTLWIIKLMGGAGEMHTSILDVVKVNKIFGPETRAFNQTTVPNIPNVTALNFVTGESLTNITIVNDWVSKPKLFLPYISPFAMILKYDDIQWFKNISKVETKLLWLNTDMSYYLDIFTPKSNIIQVREHATHIAKVIKQSLEPQPEYARPVLTTMTYEETRSIVSRQMSVVTIRRITPPWDQTIHNIKSAYLREDFGQFVSYCQANPVSFDEKATKSWLEEHPNSIDKYKSTVDLLGQEMLIKPFSDIIGMLKNESLLKTEEMYRMVDVVARSIMYHPYAIPALFSKAFVEIKNRIKLAFKDNIIYADGLRYDQLAAYVRNVSSDTIFIEDDLTKQDRQTDKPILDVEMRMYDLLGLSKPMLLLWRTVHYNKWYMKASHNRASMQYMRLTGQATTSIGNLITNLQSHSKWARKHKRNIRMALFLGDDSLYMCKEKLPITEMMRVTKEEFNIISKAYTNADYGTFCQLICYKDHDKLNLGPDYRRIRRRYTLGNGCSILTPDIINTKNQSYCMILGATPEVKAFIKTNNYNIEPEMWYSQDTLLRTLQIKYNCSLYDILNDYKQLIQLMNKPTITDHCFQVWNSKFKKGQMT